MLPVVAVRGTNAVVAPDVPYVFSWTKDSLDYFLARRYAGSPVGGRDMINFQHEPWDRKCETCSWEFWNLLTFDHFC